MESHGKRAQMNPRLCPIYKRDLATFLPRTVVDKMRQVSRSFNALMTAPARMPRLKFCSFSFYCEDENDRFNEKGFVVHRGIAPSVKWTDLTRCNAEEDCCFESIEDEASRLSDELAVINLPPKALLHVEVEVRREGDLHSKNFHLMAANRLTHYTAKALLHLLSHVNGGAMEVVSVGVEPSRGEYGSLSVINPRVLDSLSAICGRKFKLYADELRTDGTHTLTADDMEIAAKFIKFQSIFTGVEDGLGRRMPMGIETLIDRMEKLMLAAEGYCIEVRFYISHGDPKTDIDAFIKRFSAIRIGVRKLKFNYRGNFVTPVAGTELCLDEKASRRETQFDESGDKLEVFFHRFINEPSGKEFTVKIYATKTRGSGAWMFARLEMEFP